jgi:hypothetical protein
MVMTKQASSDVPRMLRGSLVVQRRRCGKPNCHCAEGVNLHETLALSYSEHGRSRTLVLPASERAAVQAAIDRYRAAVAELDAAANAGIAALTARLSARRRIR